MHHIFYYKNRNWRPQSYIVQLVCGVYCCTENKLTLAKGSLSPLSVAVEGRQIVRLQCQYILVPVEVEYM